MASFDTTEMVASYEEDGRTYQIDHLGICYASQAGDYAVYRDGEHVAEFRPGFAPVLPEDLTPDELIQLAKEAVADAASKDEGTVRDTEWTSP